MPKLKILGISKSEFRSCYTVEKNQDCFKFIRDFIRELKIDTPYPYGVILNEDDIATDKEEKIEEYFDKIDNFRNDEYSIDVIAFKEKMIVVINSKEDKQQEIAGILDKYIDW